MKQSLGMHYVQIEGHLYFTLFIYSLLIHSPDIYWVPLMCVGLNRNGEKHTYHYSINPLEIKKKVSRNLMIVLEANFICSAFLSSINIIRGWVSALFLTREIEFHELLMRLIFLRKEDWSVVSVEFSFFLVVVFESRIYVLLGRFKGVSIFITTPPQYMKRNVK